MPGGNKTGPLGFGPRTGRAAGFCIGYSGPEYMNQIRSRRFWCRGGFRNRWYWNEPYHRIKFEMDPKDEQKHLQEVVNLLEDELTEAKKRLKEVSNNSLNQE